VNNYQIILSSPDLLKISIYTKYIQADIISEIINPMTAPNIAPDRGLRIAPHPPPAHLPKYPKRPPAAAPITIPKTYAIDLSPLVHCM
jgi:hypothetical protein